MLKFNHRQVWLIKKLGRELHGKKLVVGQDDHSSLNLVNVLVEAAGEKLEMMQGIQSSSGGNGQMASQFCRREFIGALGLFKNGETSVVLYAKFTPLRHRSAV